MTNGLTAFQLDRSLRILQEQASDVHLLTLTQEAQRSIKPDARFQEISFVRPLTLDESKAVAKGALVADEEQTARVRWVGGGFVTLKRMVLGVGLFGT